MLFSSEVEIIARRIDYCYETDNQFR